MDRKNSIASTSATVSVSLYILPFILVGSFLSIFDQFVINVAAPAIISSLHPSAAEFEGIMSGYALVYGVGLIIGGRLGDRSDGDVSTASDFFFLPRPQRSAALLRWHNTLLSHDFCKGFRARSWCRRYSL